MTKNVIVPFEPNLNAIYLVVIHKQFHLTGREKMVIWNDFQGTTGKKGGLKLVNWDEITILKETKKKTLQEPKRRK